MRTPAHRLLTAATLTLVVSLPLLGMADIASAHTAAAAKAAKGSSAWCASHPKKQNKPLCTGGAGGAGTGSGTGGPPVQITVEVDPNPLVETGASEVHAVIQVETEPAFAGDEVNIASSQLSASCASIRYTKWDGARTILISSIDRINAVLDDDGNTTVVVDAFDCAPGTSVVEADLEVAPFLTALTMLKVLPPAVTPEGVTGYPQIAGVTQEVETGDTSASGDSNVYAVFYVETNPVYAEQTVEIDSSQLDSRCIRAWEWVPGNGAGVGVGVGYHVNSQNTPGSPASTILDDDGNAVFVFLGVSCAAGPSAVIADVMAGSHPTYTTSFTVDPPAITI